MDFAMKRDFLKEFEQFTKDEYKKREKENG